MLILVVVKNENHTLYGMALIMEEKILGVEKGKGRGIVITGLFKPKCY